MYIPRQPLVGVALMAAFGILVADFAPIAPCRWLIWLTAFASIALVLFWKSNAALTFACCMRLLLLHNFRTGDTPGLMRVDELGERARTVRATGVVASEPKVGPNGFATFLFNLESMSRRMCPAEFFSRLRGFSAKTTDDAALVVQLSVKTTKILFMSDSGYAKEKALIESHADLRSNILVKGQHHSGNSGLDIFLDSVQPRIIIATSREFP